MKPLWLLGICLALALPLHATPAQVIVIRHGEKPSRKDSKHLSPAGWERAERLSDYLKQTPELTKCGMPAALIAAHVTKDGGGQRTSETLEPVSKELHLPIETPYMSDHPEKLAAMILSSKKYEGKTVLICWVHEHIPALIEALGIHPAPEKLSDDVYDTVYSIRYSEKGSSLEILHQDMPSAPDGKASKLPHLGHKKNK